MFYLISIFIIFIMFKNLIILSSYRVGFHTNHIQTLMKDFNKVDEDSCIDVLKQIEKKKQYIPFSQAAESFVNRIQFNSLKRQEFVSSKTLYIYQTLKKMRLLTGSFKYQLYNKLERQINGIHEYDLNVKNSELQVLLWFLYREYPFLRETRTMNIASEHTLKLFEMIDGMNELKILRNWQSYMRVATLLQDLLGHSPDNLRYDITRKQIETLPYTYLPYLRSIFVTKQVCHDFQTKNSIHTPFYHYVSNMYINQDKMLYDAYIQYVETIQSQRQGQQTQRIFDPHMWSSFPEMLQLILRAIEFEGFDEQLPYKVDEIFWRVCETENIEMQSAIQIASLLFKNNNALGLYQKSLLNRSFEALIYGNTYDSLFIPSKAIVELMKAINGNFDKKIKNQIHKISLQMIKTTKLWEEEDRRELRSIIVEGEKKYSLEIDTEIRSILKIQNDVCV